MKQCPKCNGVLVNSGMGEFYCYDCKEFFTADKAVEISEEIAKYAKEGRIAGLHFITADSVKKELEEDNKCSICGSLLTSTGECSNPACLTKNPVMSYEQSKITDHVITLGTGRIKNPGDRTIVITKDRKGNGISRAEFEMDKDTSTGWEPIHNPMPLPRPNEPVEQSKLWEAEPIQRHGSKGVIAKLPDNKKDN